MTFNEMRLVKHLVESAREIARDDSELLDTYEGFECMMWSDDDADLKKWRSRAGNSTAACGLLSQS